MVRHGHTESLPGIDVSSRVVVTLGVFRTFFCRCDRGGEEEEGQERGAQMLLLLQTRVGKKLHCVVPVRARSY